VGAGLPAEQDVNFNNVTSWGKFNNLTDFWGKADTVSHLVQIGEEIENVEL
jgi:hypothetical protein